MKDERIAKETAAESGASILHPSAFILSKCGRAVSQRIRLLQISGSDGPVPCAPGPTLCQNHHVAWKKFPAFWGLVPPCLGLCGPILRLWNIPTGFFRPDGGYPPRISQGGFITICRDFPDD